MSNQKSHKKQQRKNNGTMQLERKTETSETKREETGIPSAEEERITRVTTIRSEAIRLLLRVVIIVILLEVIVHLRHFLVKILGQEERIRVTLLPAVLLRRINLEILGDRVLRIHGEEEEIRVVVRLVGVVITTTTIRLVVVAIKTKILSLVVAVTTAILSVVVMIEVTTAILSVVVMIVVTTAIHSVVVVMMVVTTTILSAETKKHLETHSADQGATQFLREQILYRHKQGSSSFPDNKPWS